MILDLLLVLLGLQTLTEGLCLSIIIRRECKSLTAKGTEALDQTNRLINVNHIGSINDRKTAETIRLFTRLDCLKLKLSAASL